MNFYRNMNLPVQKLDQRSVIGVGSDKMAALASHGRTWNLVFSHARTCWQHFDLEWFDIPDAWAQHCSSCFRWCLETFWSVTFAQASLKVSSSSWRFPHHCLQNGAHEGHEGDEGNEGNEGNESHEEHEVDEEGRWRGDASNEGHEGNEGNEGDEGDEVICSLMMAMLASFGSFDAPKWHSSTNTGRSSFRSVGPELSCTAPREWTQGSCHARQQKDFGWVSLKVRAFLFEVPLVEDDSRLWWFKISSCNASSMPFCHDGRPPMHPRAMAKARLVDAVLAQRGLTMVICCLGRGSGGLGCWCCSSTFAMQLTICQVLGMGSNLVKRWTSRQLQISCALC